MAFKDNRQFIEALEKTGDVIRIKQEVDWDMEAGAIARRTDEIGGPAALCEKIKDYPAGYRLFCSPLATFRRMAVALGMPAHSAPRQIAEEYEKRLQNPIKPVVVKSGPCKEKKMLGKDVDLHEFPAPLVHAGDGGRYIACWHLVITKDPKSDWTNWGMYRHMIIDRNHISGLWRSYGDLGTIYYQQYKPVNKPMPFAIALGAGPVSSMMAATMLPKKESEADYAGAMMKEPVELIKCETSDLLVPAHAEIVLEGEISVKDKAYEGPFGEFPGYRTSGSMRPLCTINAVTYRKDPIIAMSNPGVPIDEDHILMSITWGAEFKKLLKAKGIPVTDVYLPPEGGTYLVVVGVKPFTFGIAKRIERIVLAELAWQYKVIVVEEDVDVYNLAEVLHALSTKCHPMKGININKPDFNIPLTPYVSSEERRWGKGATASFDCTWPVEWSRETDIPMRVSFREIYPRDIQDKVLSNWNRWGFK